MNKKFILIICIILFTSSCGNKLNPEWYPNGLGKDTVYVVGNGKFCLGKTSVGIDLSMHNGNGQTGVVLAYVNKYKKKKDKLYVYADEGYCIVDEVENVAKVLITVQEQYFSNLVGEDESITYLSSYDEFTEEEKTVFEALRVTKSDTMGRSSYP